MSRVILILVLALASARADDITLRDGKIYKDAKIISHDATTITILYADGGATLSIVKLPDDLQKKFGFKSGQASDSQAVTDQASDWSGYRKAQDKYVSVNGKLLMRTSANVATLNVKLNRLTEMKSASGDNLGRGSLVDIYEESAPNSATLQPTGDSAFLKDYILSADKVVKIEAIKTGATESGGVYYIVLQPFSFDFWKKAGSPQ
jgi:hypothetical protein